MRNGCDVRAKGVWAALRYVRPAARPQATMLVLFDTPAGHALFKLKKPDKLKDPDSLHQSFTNVDSAQKLCASHCARTRAVCLAVCLAVFLAACLARARREQSRVPRGASAACR